MAADPVRVPWPTMRRPLVAILRGITPEDMLAVTEVLLEEGVEAIEVPLNSPRPFDAIALAVRHFGDRCWLGAGTVMTPADCARLADIGARLAVMPHCDPALLAAARRHALVSMPGVMTPTEALLAWHHGASALKFFPASVLGPAGLAAVRAVLPADAIIGAVGGVDAVSLPAYVQAGAQVLGLGTSLYRPGDKVAQVRRQARRLVRAYDAASGADWRS